MFAFAGLVLGTAIAFSRGRAERFSGLRGLGTIPPPPSDPWSYIHWLDKTYSKDTRVRATKNLRARSGHVLPAGSIGKVRRVEHQNVGMVKPDQYSILDAEFTIHKPLFLSTETSKEYYRVGNFNAGQDPRLILEPLDDNWGPLVIPSKKRRHKGRLRGLGTIPPAPPFEFPDQWKKWAMITFAAGTPVKLIGPVGRPDATTTTDLLLDPEGAGYDEYIHDIEAGMRGVTDGRFAWENRVSVKIVDARDKWGSRRTDAIGRTVLVHAWYLEPLADNWAQTQQKRSYKGRLP